MIREQREEKCRPQTPPSGVGGKILGDMNSEIQKPAVGELLVLNMPCLKEVDAAVLLNVTPKCLKKRRLNGSGPDYVRFSQRLIRYTPLAIAAYAAAHEVKSDAS